MRTVYKYPIDSNEIVQLSMPKGAEILTFQMQGDQPTLWALVDPSPAILQLTRWFRLACTGDPIDEDELGYIDSIQMIGEQLVLHLFEVRR